MSRFNLFKSEEVNVFPCSYRGIKDSATILDPEARMQSERNLTNLGANGSNNCAEVTGIHSSNSYIVSEIINNSTKAAKIDCVIDGYYFRIFVQNSEDCFNFLTGDTDKYLVIKTTNTSVNIQPGEGSKKFTTAILASVNDDSTTDKYLDKATSVVINENGDTQEVYEFLGLGYTSDFDSFKDDLNIKYLKICKESFLPDIIQHGSTEKSVTIGTGLTTDVDNAVVIGNYNEDITDKIFVVADGTKADKHNAIDIDTNGDIAVDAKHDITIGAKHDITEVVANDKNITVAKTLTETVNAKTTTAVTVISENSNTNIVNAATSANINVGTNKANINLTVNGIEEKVAENNSIQTIVGNSAKIYSDEENTNIINKNIKLGDDQTDSIEVATTNADISADTIDVAANDININNKVSGNINIGATNNKSNINVYSDNIKLAGNKIVAGKDCAVYTDKDGYVHAEDFSTGGSASSHETTIAFVSGVSQDSKGKISVNTASAIIGTSGQGQITIGEGQDNTVNITNLQTDSSPTFAGLKVTNNIDTQSLTANTSISTGTLSTSSTATIGDKLTVSKNGAEINGTLIANNETQLHGVVDTYDNIVMTSGKSVCVGSDSTKLFTAYSNWPGGGFYEHINFVAPCAGNFYIKAENGEYSKTGAHIYCVQDDPNDLIIHSNSIHLDGNNIFIGKDNLAQIQLTGSSQENVKINVTAPINSSKNITTTGEITASAFNATSDRRLKENVKEFDSEKSILDLNVYKYDFIDGNKNQIGCIAQELQEICPEIVKENDDGYLTIQENKLVYLLLNEVKKLRKEIDDLKEGR